MASSPLEREGSWSPKRLGAATSRVLGLQNLGVLLAARKLRGTGTSPVRAIKAVGVWEIPRPTASYAARIRKWAVLAGALMLVVVGAVTVTGRVLAMVYPAPVLVAATPRVSDLQFAGTAQAAALDYFTWDTVAPRAMRTGSLSRWGFVGGVGDGWEGSGRLNAENALPIAVLRTGDDRAVVTVQVRATLTPHAESPALGSNDANWPGAGETMWLTVAVPVALRDSRIALTASPAIVGSPPNQAFDPAVQTAADEDTDAGRATADTVGKLVAAYGSGDLEFVRGPGSTFTGLAGMVAAGQVQSWRMAKVAAGDDPAIRSGDVTVQWTLPSGAGQLRSTYRIELTQRENRWLLQQITPEIEVTS